MDTKLTLKLDKLVIEKAKLYAATQKHSLSRIIESYLKTLISSEPENDTDEIIISPFVMSLSKPIDIPVDYQIDYSDYLTEKYA